MYTDGIPADTESGQGSVMFINGYVLSYPTNRDVALEVTVSGIVPEGVSSVTVVSVKELDNSGSPVPGSAVTVAGPVSVPATVPPTTLTTAPPSPSPSPLTSPPPTASGGIPLPAVLGAISALGVLGMHPGPRKRP